jgi:sulfoxide reductase heme-binding subunit YedZ
MNTAPSSLHKFAVSIACFIPFLLLVSRALTGRLGANPVQTLTLSTGDWTMRLLLITLSTTSLTAATGWKRLIPLQRHFGLFALFYACLHFLVYIGLDYLFDIRLIIQESSKAPFVIVGFGSFLLLLLLGVTSIKGIMDRIGYRGWKIIHRFVYLIGIGGVVHYLLKVKVIPKELLIYTSVLGALLLFRVIQLVKGFKRKRLQTSFHT